MITNKISFNQSIGNIFDDVIHKVNSLKKAPLKKCFICHKWVDRSLINEKNVCRNCFNEEVKKDP